MAAVSVLCTSVRTDGLQRCGGSQKDAPFTRKTHYKDPPGIPSIEHRLSHYNAAESRCCNGGVRDSTCGGNGGDI